MWCFSVLDRVLVFQAFRQAALNANSNFVGSVSLRLKPRSCLYITHTEYSASLRSQWRSPNKKLLTSDLDRFIIRIRKDENVKNRIFIHNSINSCRCKHSRNVKKGLNGISGCASMPINRCKCSRNLNKIMSDRHFSISVTYQGSIDTEDTGVPSDSEDDDIKPALDSVIPSTPSPNSVDIVPGKGPPPEPPVDCCMSGCANCVWIQYAEELKTYYSLTEGNERAKDAIEQIENPGLKMFLKLELGLL